jgi:hypothetical protein
MTVQEPLNLKLYWTKEALADNLNCQIGYLHIFDEGLNTFKKIS